jgi:hypothetical protein
MKPRGLVLLSVIAAVLSTSAIVAAAQEAAKPPKGVALKKLKKFDVRFNQTINHVIRESSSSVYAQKAFVAANAFKSFIDVSAYAFRKKGTDLVKLDRADQQELRDRVNRWLDDIYVGKVPADQIRALKFNRDFFSEKIQR